MAATSFCVVGIEQRDKVLIVPEMQSATVSFVASRKLVAGARKTET